MIDKLLGEGAFSLVYRAIDLRDRSHVAIKVIDKSKLLQKQFANCKNEITLMKKLQNHPNILKLLHHYSTDQFLYLVLENCKGGEIFNKIIEYTYFLEDLSRHVFVQILSALDHLHNVKNIVHRDIKPENLLFEKIPYVARDNQGQFLRRSDDASKMDEGAFQPGIGGGTIGVVKLADFGLAKQLKHETLTDLKTPCGTAGYTAPEVITCNAQEKKLKQTTDKSKRFLNLVSKKNYYLKAVDIWSLGCLLYTILCGFPPFYDEDNDVLTQKIIKGEYVFLSPWWDEISDQAKDLINRMLVIDPEERITILEIWMHPWVKQLNLASECIEDYFQFDKEENFTEHIEFAGQTNHSTEDCYPEPQVRFDDSFRSMHNKSPAAAEAIKKVFSNPAMMKLKKSSPHSATLKLTVGAPLHHRGQNKYPKTPVQELSHLTFKNVFDFAPDNEDGDDDDENVTDDSYEGLTELDSEGVSSESHISVDETRDRLTELSEVIYGLASGSSRGGTPYSEEDYLHIVGHTELGSGAESHFGETDYLDLHQSASDQTRSSSIISNGGADATFTMNLNDSKVWARRKSLIKSHGAHSNAISTPASENCSDLAGF